MSAPGGMSAPVGGVHIPACTEADTPPPPVNRITDTSKNITLATTSLRPVIIFPSIAEKNYLINSALTCEPCVYFIDVMIQFRR